MEFETADFAMRGEMTVTFTLTDADGGTGVLAVHDHLPPGVAPADNETGWRMALEKLARFFEAGLKTEALDMPWDWQHPARQRVLQVLHYQPKELISCPISLPSFVGAPRSERTPGP